MNDIVSLSSVSNAQVQLEHARAASESNSSGSSGSAAVGQPREDSVTLSNTAGLVQQALSAGAAPRASRVQELKQQFENGQLSVDPAAVGSALIGAAIAGD
jgi:flagellar biosynthesis anti-sigma factor FlgM